MMNIFFIRWTFVPSWSGDGSDGIDGGGRGGDIHAPKTPAGSGSGNGGSGR